jgi:ABC-type lipoprotein export system ATPase subunit
LARALVLKTPLMLIDEPTANLDAAARDQVKVLLESLRAEGRIVVIATHDPALTALAETRKWQLRDGKLIAVG